jgi:hypothetical protein
MQHNGIIEINIHQNYQQDYNFCQNKLGACQSELNTAKQNPISEGISTIGFWIFLSVIFFIILCIISLWINMLR